MGTGYYKHVILCLLAMLSQHINRYPIVTWLSMDVRTERIDFLSVKNHTYVDLIPVTNTSPENMKSREVFFVVSQVIAQDTRVASGLAVQSQSHSKIKVASRNWRIVLIAVTTIPYKAYSLLPGGSSFSQKEKMSPCVWRSGSKTMRLYVSAVGKLFSSLSSLPCRLLVSLLGHSMTIGH